ncbi:MAG TPA: type II toxin-antitoxin system PemK/MazF family toxin [Desulfotomaculum sp.]|nr:type II toxin-antitoxin system PemK/MazF family toxin [Desulfotomaculum sp.]
MVVYQWNIFWANLDPGKGSEQAGKRPVLVISTEEANEVLPVVTIMAITSLKEGRKIYPTEVLIRAEDTGLSKDSIAMAHQIRAIAKERLEEKGGEILAEDFREQIRKAIRIYLEL